MHELAITQSILDTSLEQAKAVRAMRISQINLVIGEMSTIVDDCVQFYFDFFSKDTIAEGAVLSFQRVPTKMQCHNCDTVFQLSESGWICPYCNRWDAEILSGQELYIDSIEVE